MESILWTVSLLNCLTYWINHHKQSFMQNVLWSMLMFMFNVTENETALPTRLAWGWDHQQITLKILFYEISNCVYLFIWQFIHDLLKHLILFLYDHRSFWYWPLSFNCSIGHLSGNCIMLFTVNLILKLVKIHKILEKCWLNFPTFVLHLLWHRNKPLKLVVMK